MARNTSVGQMVTKMAKEEGKISQVSVGNIREVLAIMSDWVYADLKDINSWEAGWDGTISALYLNGERRFKRRKKK